SWNVPCIVAREGPAQFYRLLFTECVDKDLQLLLSYSIAVRSNGCRDQLFSESQFIPRTGEKYFAQMLDTPLPCCRGLPGTDVDGNVANVIDSVLLGFSCDREIGGAWQA